MDETPWIAVKRFPYEEPYATCIEVRAWSGDFGGAATIFCNVTTLGEIGRSLMAFPSKVPDEYEFHSGSDLRLRAYTFNSTGHCAIRFEMNRNSKPPFESRCCFSIVAEPARVSRLGELFCNLERDAQSHFRWTPTGDEFFPTSDAV
jgi:hypothetical protein